MHSRIIELGNEPILPDDRMGESSVPEWFYHSTADYTDEETDREADLKWFLEIVAHIVDVAEDGESFTFKPNAKKKYFYRQYYAFLDKARELTGISLEAFCAETPYDIGMAMYKLNEAYQDKFSFYIYYQDELKTLDEWIRETDLSGSFYQVWRNTPCFSYGDISHRKNAGSILGKRYSYKVKDALENCCYSVITCVSTIRW